MITRKYYFQVIDDLEQTVDPPPEEDLKVEPPYSIFYVERSDVGNIPIYDFTPGGGKWWFLNEENIRWNQSRTEEPTPHFEAIGRQIAEFPPAVSNNLHPEEVTEKGELSISEEEIEPLPQHEVDLIREIIQALSQGKNLPVEIQNYLSGLTDGDKG